MEDNIINLLYDEAAERSVLGSILKDDILFEEVESYSNELFYKTVHQKIFQAMKENREKELNIDLITVGKVANTEYNVPITYTSQLYNDVISNVNFSSYVNILVEFMNKRIIFKALETVDFKNDVNIIQESLYKTLDDTLLMNFNVESTKDSLLNHVGTINSPMEHLGIRTGLTTLDDRIGGIKTGITTIAGYTSMGKSVMAVQLMLNMLRNNKKVDYFSIEMTREEIFNRMLANGCSIQYSNINLGKTSEKEKEGMTHFIATFLLGKDFEIYDNISEINKIITQIKKDKLKRNIDIVFIDLINRVEDCNVRDISSNRANYLSTVSRRLKTLSNKLNIPIVITAQINRAVEQRQDKMPTLADIKESGGIAEDSDLVLILYRNKELDKAEVREELQSKGILNYYSKLADVNPQCINISLAKGRNTKTFTGAYHWNGEFQRIGNLA